MALPEVTSDPAMTNPNPSGSDDSNSNVLSSPDAEEVLQLSNLPGVPEKLHKGFKSELFRKWM